MAISVNWESKLISVPQADLTLISGTTYEIDLDDLRRDLRALEASAAGIPYPDTHNHNTSVTVGNVILARVVEFVNGYTIEFEDGQYGVNVVGGNSNISDVLVRNQVSVNTANSAGLIAGGSNTFGPADRADLQTVKKRTGALMGTI